MWCNGDCEWKNDVCTLKGDRRADAPPPWIVVLDDFLSVAEAQHVMAHLKGDDVSSRYHLSSLAAKSAAGSTDDSYRRSESFQCEHSCLHEEWVTPIVQKIARVTGLGMQHSEDMTLTRYQKGGFYKRHHDYIIRDRNPRGWENCGNRILTFLLYLNDVNDGGGTHFFHLGQW